MQVQCCNMALCIQKGCTTLSIIKVILIDLKKVKGTAAVTMQCLVKQHVNYSNFITRRIHKTRVENGCWNSLTQNLKTGIKVQYRSRKYCTFNCRIIQNTIKKGIKLMKQIRLIKL